MTAGEIATAVRYGVNFVTVVLTDNDLALIRIKQQKKHYPIYGTPVRATGAIGGPDIFGARVLTGGRCAKALRRALAQAFAADAPVIVEALVDSRENTTRWCFTRTRREPARSASCRRLAGAKP